MICLLETTRQIKFKNHYFATFMIYFFYFCNVYISKFITLKKKIQGIYNTGRFNSENKQFCQLTFSKVNQRRLEAVASLVSSSSSPTKSVKTDSKLMQNTVRWRCDQLSIWTQQRHLWSKQGSTSNKVVQVRSKSIHLFQLRRVILLLSYLLSFCSRSCAHLENVLPIQV